MRKRKTTTITAALFTALVLFAGCGEKPSAEENSKAPTTEKTQEQTKQTADTAVSDGAATGKLTPAAKGQEPGETVSYGTPEEGVMRSMTLADPDGNLYYVDVNTGVFFTAPIPEDLTDADGNPITPDDIKAGCVVDIYGNGMMLESYPGQYPGTSKMVLVREGTAQDAAPYQHLVDEIYAPADPSEPPSMNAEYRTELADTTVILTRGNYEWSYTDENGKTQNVIACGSHILAWPQLNDISIGEDIASGLELTLRSSYKPETVTVTRFPLEAWHKDPTAESGMLPGETVEVLDTAEAYAITAEAGYVYLVEAVWAEGRAEFGFYTK